MVLEPPRPVAGRPKIPSETTKALSAPIQISPCQGVAIPPGNSSRWIGKGMILLFLFNFFLECRFLVCWSVGERGLAKKLIASHQSSPSTRHIIDLYKKSVRNFTILDRLLTWRTQFKSPRTWSTRPWGPARILYIYVLVG